MIKFTKNLILIVILFLLNISVFSISIPTYIYNSDTEHWELIMTNSIVKIRTFINKKIRTAKIDSDATSSVLNPKSYSGNSNTDIPFDTSVDTMPPPRFSSGQWYYYITYTIGSANANTKKDFTLWAGQSIDCGTVYVWDDLDSLYVKYVTKDRWLLDETHVNVVTDKPTGNQVPGQFPYKTEYPNPVGESLYQIPLSDEWKNTKEIYILAHAVVVKPVTHGKSIEETAWAGEFTNCMKIEISGTKIAWFVKKPGKYFSKVLEMSVKSDLPVIVTFSNFSNLEAEDAATLSSFYSITENLPPQSWLTPDEINFLYLELSNSSKKLYVWQMIVLNNQSSSSYKNRGVITFTLKNVKEYNEVP